MMMMGKKIAYAQKQGIGNMEIDVINLSSRRNTAVINAVAAVQVQMDEHFAPLWKINGNLHIVQRYRGNPTVFIMDFSDDVDILGYHDINSQGIPVGYVFAEDSAEEWTVSLDHEVLEMLADPFVNVSAEGQYLGKPAFYAYENCDPVQEDVYRLNGVLLSNFVFPSWFIPDSADRYDFMGVLDSPFTLGDGGYFSFFRAAGKWIDVTNSSLLPVDYKAKFSRWMRRRRLNNNDFQRKDAQTIQLLPNSIIYHNLDPNDVK